MLAHDLGDAVFRRLILGLEYKGENPRFWGLIENTGRRTALENFFDQNHDSIRQARASHEATLVQDNLIGDANPALRDHFLLFEREYEEQAAKNGDEAACVWATKLLGGLTEQEAAALAERAFDEETRMPLRSKIEIAGSLASHITPAHIDLGIAVRPQMVSLVGQLRQMGFEVFLASASNHYAVQVAAKRFGIDSTNAFGIRLKSVNGLLVDELDDKGPVPWGPGKVEVIPGQFKAKVRLVAGDSLGDVQMLQGASEGDGAALVLDRGAIPQKYTKTWIMQPAAALDRRAGAGRFE